jgi:antitoxin YefM
MVLEEKVMITGIRQKTVVGEGGKIEIVSPELPGGTLVEVIVLVEPVEQDTTEYLLSTEANRNHLLQALQDLEKPDSYIYVDPADL